MKRSLSRDRNSALLEIVLELLAARWMTQLAQRLGLDLPDALSRDTEALAHLFERPLVSVDEAEAKLQHPALARGQRVEDVLHLGAQHGARGRLGWRGGFLVLDEVTEMGVLLLADGRLQRDRILGNLRDLADLLGRD